MAEPISDSGSFHSAHSGQNEEGEPSSLEIHAVPREMNIAVAGKSGAGKTTLFNNLLGYIEDPTLSPNAVTKEIVKEVKRMNGGITLNIFDNPGLEKNSKRKREQLKALSKRKIALLLYCVPVGPGSKFEDDNPMIMKSLQEAFGKRVWERCALIFTFSNLARDRAGARNRDEELAISNYKEYIIQYASKFQQELREKLGVGEIKVTTIFDQNHTANGGIVAIPAGDELEDTARILPGIETDQEDGWRGKIFEEMIRKMESPNFQMALLQYRYGEERAKTAINSVRTSISGGRVRGVLMGGAGGGVTVLVGTGIGAGAGIAGGPIGMVVGGTLGAAVSIIVATLVAAGVIGGKAAADKLQPKKGGN